MLTDEEFFQGSLDDLEAARAAVAIPVLRKDFTLDEVHVIEAAAHGADAILLIAALLDRSRLARSSRDSRALSRWPRWSRFTMRRSSMQPSPQEPEIIGVNNRDLHTFEVTLETSLRLAPKIPSGVVKVTESGIDSRAAVMPS